MEVLRFLYSQLFVDPALAQKSLEGKIVVITGANVGLGYDCGIHLARCKPKLLILACRSLEKGNTAAKEVIAASGFDNVEAWELDLSSYKSVIAFARKFQATHKQLDILIENAGVSMEKYYKTEDEHELTMQTNWSAHNLLTFLLLPQLRASPTPKLVVVSSEVHGWTKLTPDQATFEFLDKEENFAKQTTYCRSKLANIFFVDEFHKRFPDIPICSVNPGLCRSSFARNIGDGGVFGVMLYLLGRTSEAGSRNLVWAALEAPGQGEYVSDSSVSQTSTYSRSAEGKKAQLSLWSEMEKDLKKAYPAIKVE